MNQYVDRMLNEGFDLLQFAAVCAPAMAVEDSRHYREVDPKHDQAIEASMRRINELVLASPEEALELHVARLTELQAQYRVAWAQSVIIAAMRERVEAWEPGANEAIQGLKRLMLEELNHGPNRQLLELHQQRIDAHRALSPQAYLEQLFQEEKRTIERAKEAQQVEAERAAEWRAWREALKVASIELEEA